MNIFFYANFSNNTQFLKIIKKKFKDHQIYTIGDKFDYESISIAMIWKLPNNEFKKLINLQLIFSLGAGVDHILKLSSYDHTPIVRIKDPNMRDRMFNHALSQILTYQLKLSSYSNAQQKKIWLDERLDERITALNHNLTVGVLGLGYIGNYVAKKLKNLGYNIIGYRKTKTTSNKNFPVFFNESLEKFIIKSDIILSILPATSETNNLIDKKFLLKLKKKSLLINIGRGSTVNENDLMDHVNSNIDSYASLDVFKNEPLNKNHKFWKHPNITVTPHIAAITDVESSIEYMFDRFNDYVKVGNIKSDVSLKKGY